MKKKALSGFSPSLVAGSLCSTPDNAGYIPLSLHITRRKKPFRAFLLLWLRKSFCSTPDNAGYIPLSLHITRRKKPFRTFLILWLRELDLNQRPSGYEPDELPSCSIPRHLLSIDKIYYMQFIPLCQHFFLFLIEKY